MNRFLQLSNNFDLAVDSVRRLSKNLCEPLGITTFGYVRIYNNGMISWVTTNPDQDRFLLESDALNQHPQVDTKPALKEGCYLDNYNHAFPGSEQFYKERAKRFKMDHGMIVVRHQKDYVETCCFSGLSTIRPLYPLFMNEQGIFRAFMDHFIDQLDSRLRNILLQCVPLSSLKDKFGKAQSSNLDRKALLETCGWKNLLTLSRRETECLLLLRKGHTYQGIGQVLGLSERTVEHYLNSVKNKLGLESRAELFLAAEKLVQFHFTL